MTIRQPIKTLQIEQLPVAIYENNEIMGQAAASEAQAIITSAIEQKGTANVILATGNSQLTFLKNLRESEAIDWARVNTFHMDEFLGIDPNHRASFPRFLHKHFLDYVNVGNFFPVSGRTEEADRTCQQYEALLRKYPADMVAMWLWRKWSSGL